MNQRYALLAGAAVMLAVGISVAVAGFNDAARLRASGDALAWARTQNVRAGQVQYLRLPAVLARSSQDGTVAVAHLADGRYCILLVKHVGWKDNFEGRLVCSGQLLASEFVKPEDGRSTYVSIPGYGVFEELYIRKARNDRDFDVYFDLN